VNKNYRLVGLVMKYIKASLMLFILLGSVQAGAVTYGGVTATGSAGADYGKAVAVDVYGNVYTSGYFQNTVDFNPDPVAVDNHTTTTTGLFISKTNADGSYAWTQSIAGGGQSWSPAFQGNTQASLAIDLYGNIYAAGFLNGTVDFDPSLIIDNQSGSQAGFITKFDNNGVYSWTTVLPARVYDVTTDIYGNIYSTGGFQGTVDFNAGVGVDSITSAGSTDFFLNKINADGSYGGTKVVWAGTSGDQGNAVTTDASGNVYVVGRMRDPFGTYGDDAYVVKYGANVALGANSTPLWSRLIAGIGFDNAADVAVDALGNVYVAGAFSDTVDFATYFLGATPDSHTSKGRADAFITQIKADGTYGWTQTFGGTNSVSASKVSIDSYSNVFVTGSFYGYGNTADFNPSPTVANNISPAQNSNFISRFTNTGTYIWTETFGVQEPADMAIDTFSNMYLQGNFFGTVDFDVTSAVDNHTAGYQDAFTLKLGGLNSGLGLNSRIGTTAITTPTLTFYSSVAGLITYGGSCSSATVNAVVGANTITLNTLIEGAYSNCTISVAGVPAVLNITPFTIDLTPPAAPVITGEPVADVYSTNNTPGLAGTAEVNATVSIIENGVTLGQTTADRTGNWWYSLGQLVDGSYTFTATATDIAGNVSANGLSFSFGVDTTGPVLSFVLPQDTYVEAGSPAYLAVDLNQTDNIDGSSVVSIVPTVSALPVGIDLYGNITTPVAATAGWSLATDFYTSGTYSMKSDLITHNQTAEMEYTTTFEAGSVSLSFDYKVESEDGSDVLDFYIDGVAQTSSWSGLGAGWQSVSYPITAGVHTLKFVYSKDGSASDGADRVWIDNLAVAGQNNMLAQGVPTDLYGNITTPVVATAGWSMATDFYTSGTYSMKSDLITHNQTAEMEYTSTFVSGTVSFDYKVESEDGYDFLDFYIDGVVQASNWSGLGAGWQSVSYPITAGVHTLKFVYSKDGSASDGADRAWIDNLKLPSTPPLTWQIGSYQLSYVSSDASGNVSLPLTHNIIVRDTTKPILNVSMQNISVVAGTTYTYTDPSVVASASDNIDGDITANIMITSDAFSASPGVYTAVPGVYTIVFNVSDASGNAAASVSRTVTVTTAAGATPAGGNACLAPASTGFLPMLLTMLVGLTLVRRRRK